MDKILISEEIRKELWQIYHPGEKIDEIAIKRLREKFKAGKRLVNLPKKEYLVLTTARNRNLITFDEQKKLSKTVVGFFGLSVGSHAALTWMMEIRAEAIKIADPERIALSNLNRMRVGWDTVGKLKVEKIKEELYQMNPYTRVFTLINTTPYAIRKFFNSPPVIKVVVDEIDNLEGKFFLRKLSREKKIPLISATDIGDNVMIDIERYDLEPQPEFFLGHLSALSKVQFSNLSSEDKKKLSFQLAGFEQNSEKMLDSLLSIGESIVTWPQLGATAAIAGGVVTTVIKKIILGEKIKSGRYFISLDEILVADFNDKQRRKIRQQKTKRIQKLLGLSIL